MVIQGPGHAGRGGDDAVDQRGARGDILLLVVVAEHPDARRGRGPIVPGRLGHRRGGGENDRQRVGEGALGVDDGPVDAIDLLGLGAGGAERGTLADAVSHGADVALERDAGRRGARVVRTPARTILRRGEEHQDGMLGGIEVARLGRGVRRTARRGRAREHDLHPTTTVRADDRGLEIILHRIEHGAGLALGGQVGDGAIVGLEGLRGD